MSLLRRELLLLLLLLLPQLLALLPLLTLLLLELRLLRCHGGSLTLLPLATLLLSNRDTRSDRMLQMTEMESIDKRKEGSRVQHAAGRAGGRAGRRNPMRRPIYRWTRHASTRAGRQARGQTLVASNDMIAFSSK